MASTLTSEQIELRDSARSYFAEHAPLAYVRERFESGPATDEDLWRKLINLGVLSVCGMTAADGGASCRDVGLIAVEAGYALLPENLVDAACALHFLSRHLSTDDRASVEREFGTMFLDEIANGAQRIGIAPFAYSSDDLNVARFISGGSVITALLAADRANGRLTLYKIVESDSATNTSKCTAEDGIDRTERRFRMELHGLFALPLPSLNLKKMSAIYGAVKACELFGATNRSLEMTIEYVKTRKQFDVPVGGFQAVQHAAADMLVKVNALQALCDFACWTVESSPEQLDLAAGATRVFAVDTAASIVEKAIQLHGGIGFTWEHDLHLLLRRVRTVAALIDGGEELATDLISAASSS